MTVSFITTNTPRLADCLSAAVTYRIIELNRPSALIDVEGRIAPAVPRRFIAFSRSDGEISGLFHRIQYRGDHETVGAVAPRY